MEVWEFGSGVEGAMYLVGLLDDRDTGWTGNVMSSLRGWFIFLHWSNQTFHIERT